MPTFIFIAKDADELERITSLSNRLGKNNYVTGVHELDLTSTGKATFAKTVAQVQGSRDGGNVGDGLNGPATIFCVGFSHKSFEESATVAECTWIDLLGDRHSSQFEQLVIQAIDRFGRAAVGEAVKSILSAKNSDQQSVTVSRDAPRQNPVECIFRTGRSADSRTDDPPLTVRRTHMETDWRAPPTDKTGNCISVLTAATDASTAATGVIVFATLEDDAFDPAILDALAAQARRDGMSALIARRSSFLVLEATLPLAGLMDHAGQACDRLADAAIAAFIGGARPVAAWRTSFFVALEDDGGAIRERLDRKLAPCDANGIKRVKFERPGTYWLPEVREMIAPGAAGGHGTAVSGQTFRSWSVTPPPGAKVKVAGGNYSRTLELPVTAIAIHANPGRTVLLEWTVEHSISLPEEPDGCWWRQATNAPVATGRDGTAERSWSLAQVVDFNAEARILLQEDYPRATVLKNGSEASITCALQGFLESADNAPPGSPPPDQASRRSDNRNTGGNRRGLAGFTVGSIVEVLMHHALKLDKHGMPPFIQLTDQRARVLTSIILEGPQPQGAFADSLDPVLARISTVDPYGRRHAYDDSFSRETEFAAASYRRFWSWGSHFMASPHSFAFVGYRHHDLIDKPDGKGDKARPSFAEKEIHGQHMAGIYARLYRVFLAIEANLREMAMELADFETRLAEGDVYSGTRDISGAELDELTGLRHRLDSLTDRLQRADFSSQVQGRELTELLRRQTGVMEGWRELDARIRLVEEQWNRQSQRAAERRAKVLSVSGLVFAIAFTLLGLRPTLLDSVQDIVAPALSPLDWVWRAMEALAAFLHGRGFEPGFSGFLAFVLTVAVLSWAGLWLLPRLIRTRIALFRSWFSKGRRR
jgi:hypothetical protein